MGRILRNSVYLLILGIALLMYAAAVWVGNRPRELWREGDFGPSVRDEGRDYIEAWAEAQRRQMRGDDGAPAR